MLPSPTIYLLLLCGLFVTALASCPEKCSLPTFDCTETFPDCLSKGPTVVCMMGNTFHCILPVKLDGPLCPQCNDPAFNCSGIYQVDQCPNLLYVCPDKINPAVYYCVEKALPTTLPPITTITPAPTTTTTTTPAPTTTTTTTPAPTTTTTTTPAPTTTTTTTPAPTTTTTTTLAPTTITTTTPAPTTTTTMLIPTTTTTPQPPTTSTTAPPTTIKPDEPGKPGNGCKEIPGLPLPGPGFCLQPDSNGDCPQKIIFSVAPYNKCDTGYICCVVKQS